ncbi:MAG: 3-hydroxyacyl-CoA dehydrogenase family protein [Bacteroidia bacterium]|nr:3-hydroxyacyl-CoA dehydrogenase family protein [Bacteroidia bacterium]
MTNFKTVGIIGEGKMGTSIFYSLLNFPFSLRWIGSPEADVEKLHQNLEKKIRRTLRNGIMSQDEHDALLQRTIISSDLNYVGDCDLVIEAIPEQLTLKRQLFSELNRVTQPNCILASNSSSFNPSQFFLAPGRDSKIVGMHYFYPVALKDTVELIFTDQTSSDVRLNTETFLQQTGKLILQLNEINSFILNRLFLDIQNEAYRIVEQGIASVEQIDALIKEHLFSVGLFDIMDSIGIDIMLDAVKNYTSTYPHQDYYSGLINKLQALADEGKLGLKSCEGFYRYQDGQRTDSSTTPPLSHDVAREITDHLRFTYLNTAKRFTMQSGCTIDEMNQAIREYFGLEKGPFE